MQGLTYGDGGFQKQRGDKGMKDGKKSTKGQHGKKGKKGKEGGKPRAERPCPRVCPSPRTAALRRVRPSAATPSRGAPLRLPWTASLRLLTWPTTCA